ncbi:MAG TPA: L,D-transpeptidase [Marmoricola sp.]|nr:L,D-transpeptidase [Marmoricola sp.]
MSRHRLEPPRPVRPRLGRIAAAGASLAVTMVALLGFLGVIPIDGSGSADDGAQVVAGHTSVSGDTSAAGAASAGTEASRSQPDRTLSHALEQVSQPGTETRASNALPEASGQGRRVVFSKSAQRVWLVDRNDAVTSTYLVSGSVTNNLGPGKYSVYSRSRWAVGVDDSGVMQYFVRFAHGPHAAIGFHSIPTKNGVPLQTEKQLGTPQSHGCIRQRLSDAVRLWNFAGVGTRVVVVA